MTRKRHRLAWLWYMLGALMLLIVAVVSLTPLPQESIEVNDKLSHLLAYALLSGWFSLLVRSPSALVWTAAGLVLYGIGIEILQSQTNYRFAEWADVIANSLGVLLGICLCFTPAAKLFDMVDRKLGALFLHQ